MLSTVIIPLISLPPRGSLPSSPATSPPSSTLPTPILMRCTLRFASFLCQALTLILEKKRAFVKMVMVAITRRNRLLLQRR
uniref:Auxin response factor n=1 Tax=Rhizophora mucronata TaxID=61149 RepID=A0A2P2PKT9_RHIMU